MPGEQLLDRLMHLVSLAQEVLALAALGFGSIRGQLNPVDGEHLAPDQPLPIADHEDLGKHLAYRATQRAYKGCQRTVVRLAIA